MNYKELFFLLYEAKNEYQVKSIIEEYPQIFENANWKPLGENDSNYGVVENQQSNPIAALVEKITNSSDAILMKRCLIEKIDPKSPSAPNSIAGAVETFFPNHKNWDLSEERKSQAEEIQIVADSEPKDTANTSLIIYDNGEGQHPENFETTFLSLLRGNKNEIHFVQGKYNMGGSGAIAFCGKERYQLIASKRYTTDGEFGFTLVRRHPLTAKEAKTKKNTWYEYLLIDGVMPSFPITELDLGLHNRLFQTGTIIKLYSYDTKGNRNIRRDMARSINEFLYEPALPIYMVERKSRYPNDAVLEAPIFGLKRQLIDNEYVDETFSEVFQDKTIGEMKVTVHVFKNRAKNRSAKETKTYVQREFFKNNMVVLFSMNGQVHGHYTTEFITRTLKYNLLRDSLLIHVDCTKMNYDFRSELFMASRDRLKQGEESKHLRTELGKSLRSGQLSDIYKRRKDSISVDAGEDNTLLQNFAENLPMNNELRNLLSQTFKLDSEDKPKKKKSKPTNTNKSDNQVNFNPQRFPTFFNLDTKNKAETPVIRIPLGGSKTVQFDSDVESQYFDRIEEPGDMQIAVMKYTPNEVTGGNEKGTANDISDIFTVTRKSPQNGKIKVVFKPTEDISVGDDVQVKVNLESPAHISDEFQEIFWVKVTEPLPDQPQNTSQTEVEDKIGLPNYTLVYQQIPDDMKDMGIKTWDDISDTFDMSYDDVMYPLVEGEILDRIFINMDSNVFKSYKSKYRNISTDQEQLARNRYISAVYFHTIFLYVINRQRQFQIYRVAETEEENFVDLGEYLRDVFASHYAAFLLNFGTSELMDGLS